MQSVSIKSFQFRHGRSEVSGGDKKLILKVRIFPLSSLPSGMECRNLISLSLLWVSQSQALKKYKCVQKAYVLLPSSQGECSRISKKTTEVYTYRNTDSLPPSQLLTCPRAGVSSQQIPSPVLLLETPALSSPQKIRANTTFATKQS